MKFASVRDELAADYPVDVACDVLGVSRSGASSCAELKAAGVPTTYRNYEGVTHEFFGMAPVVAASEKAQDAAAQDLREAFAGKPQAK